MSAKLAQLRFVGRDNVKIYDASHFLRQEPQPVSHWQDSAWLNWWDDERKAGGIHRIGHEYNNPGSEGPMVAAWSSIATPKGVSRQVRYLPLREADKLANGWGGGDDSLRIEFDDRGSLWIINDDASGISATLRFTDFHAPFRGFPSAGRTSEDIAPDHIDISGRITGSVIMQGATFNVDGLGIRDHGWGHRDYDRMRSHRYMSGTFGKDLSFCSWAVHNTHSDTVEIFGWVMKGDTAIFPRDIDMVTYTEIDSASTRGGRIRFLLPDGEVLDSELTAVAPGFQNYFHNMPCLNTLCVATCNGRTGAGMLESSMNFHGGTRVPTRMQRGLVGTGFFPALPEDQWNHAGSPFITKRTI